MAGCLGKGIEMRGNFVVRVKHDGKPLPGVAVWITSNAESNRMFSGTTARDGTVNVANLSPGEYWLNAELLGILAGSECFHIESRSSRKAKKSVTYDWGNLAPTTRQVVGKLIDSQPGQGGTPLWNLLHRVEVPIAQARLRLQNPLTGAISKTLSDDEGHFSFDGIPNGTYVLHIDGGTASGGSEYAASDHVIKVSDTAKQGTLLLEHRDAGGGSCGGTGLKLQDQPNT